MYNSLSEDSEEILLTTLRAFYFVAFHSQHKMKYVCKLISQNITSYKAVCVYCALIIILSTFYHVIPKGNKLEKYEPYKSDEYRAPDQEEDPKLSLPDSVLH